jgi:hypothetical protein
MAPAMSNLLNQDPIILFVRGFLFAYVIWMVI